MTPTPPKILGDCCFKLVLSNHDSALLAEKIMALVPTPRTSCLSVMALKICSHITHTASDLLEKKLPDFSLQPSTTRCYKYCYIKGIMLNTVRKTTVS